MSKLPDWVITGLVWIIGAIVFYFLFFSCSVYQPLPGLCYTDRTGTYVCPV
jgi:hypothetical protein